MSGFARIAPAELPEWIVGDAADTAGYSDADDYVYLLHARPPRFVLAAEVVVDSVVPGAREYEGKIAWLDPPPDAAATARWMAQAARVLAECEETDSL